MSLQRCQTEWEEIDQEYQQLQVNKQIRNQLTVGLARCFAMMTWLAWTTAN